MSPAHLTRAPPLEFTGRSQLDGLFGGRVLKAYFLGVEEQPPLASLTSVAAAAGHQCRSPLDVRLAVALVEGVAHDCVADGLQMHSQLVRSARNRSKLYSIEPLLF